MSIIIFLSLLFWTEEPPPNFESDCTAINSWIGGIQGVEQSNKTAPYLMAECHSNLNYDLIWVQTNKQKRKSEISAFELKKHLNEEVDEEINKFKCYAFVIPKIEPIDPENEFDTYDYVFPSNVIIYEKIDNEWMAVNGATINSFEEFGELKLRTVLGKRSLTSDRAYEFSGF